MDRSIAGWEMVGGTRGGLALFPRCPSGCWHIGGNIDKAEQGKEGEGERERASEGKSFIDLTLYTSDNKSGGTGTP